MSVKLVHCGQTAGWINMPLGMEVGPAQSTLGYRPCSPPERGTEAPYFSVHVYCDQTVAELSNC